MKPAVFLYGVPGQYGNYAAALEAAGARVVLCRDLYRSLDCRGLLLPAVLVDVAVHELAHGVAHRVR